MTCCVTVTPVKVPPRLFRTGTTLLASLLLVDREDDDQAPGCSAMSFVFKDSAAETAAKRSFAHSPSRRRNLLRLRGKGPSWTGLALLVLAVDLVLAAAAWNAVDFFRN